MLGIQGTEDASLGFWQNCNRQTQTETAGESPRAAGQPARLSFSGFEIKIKVLKMRAKFAPLEGPSSSTPSSATLRPNGARG